MKKSFVTAVVTTLFVVYSFFQRTFGAQAAPGLVPSPAPNPSNVAAGAPQGTSGNPTPAPGRGSSSQGSPTDQTQVAQANPAQAPRSGRTRGVPNTGPTTAPQATRTPTQPAQQTGSQLKDGSYTGTAANAFYGNIQVQATIANGQLTNIQFLQWPNDRSRSVWINQQALPMLVQEAIQAQSGNVDIISGATDSSQAFAQSLQSALGRAQTAVGQAQSGSGQPQG